MLCFGLLPAAVFAEEGRTTDLGETTKPETPSKSDIGII